MAGVLSVLTCCASTTGVAQAGPATGESRASTTVVINEVSTDGPNGQLDEFVEIRNISSEPQDLRGLTLRLHQQNCGTTDSIPIPSGIVLAPKGSPGQFLVMMGPNFSGVIVDDTNVAPYFARGQGLASPAGAVSLRSGIGTPVDAVAWAPSPLGANCRMEGPPARFPVGMPGAAMSRDYPSNDTDSNFSDFHIHLRTAGESI
ncbi:lamin tail domain-containing protein [Amycolatopsis sp. NPDC059657]|uniref:lamin tail domain-containing protein n=1 Tax=Amycolatopsis sp. NPDC059657 TaxID=3346899 RepID=UPI00366B49B2